MEFLFFNSPCACFNLWLHIRKDWYFQASGFGIRSDNVGQCSIKVNLPANKLLFLFPVLAPTHSYIYPHLNDLSHSHPPLYAESNLLNMSHKWNGENETRLLLILLAHYSKTGPGPAWTQVAALMGEGYTAGGVGQHFTKKLAKREAFLSAKVAFGGLPPATGTPTGTKRKRAAIEGVKVEAEDEVSE
jgi:hypothetical protein